MLITVAEIAKWINGQIEGDSSIEISGLAKIEEAKPGHLTFIANPKYAKFIHTTQASAVMVGLDFPASTRTLIRVEQPYFCFLTLLKKFYIQAPCVAQGVHPTAVIGEGTKIEEQAAIGAHVVIGRDCHICRGVSLYPGVVLGDQVIVGEDSILYANVSVREQCRIGRNVILHMGAVVGADGFGFVFEGGQYHKLPQTGIVVIEDDVEIGANTTIDRATLGETVIRRGSKLDNLIQIAHNVVIGEHTAIAAQVGISGSTIIGKYVKMGGQAGLVGHIHIGDNTIIGAQAGVTKSIAPDAFVTGYPAREHIRAKREEAVVARLPELLKRVKALEEQVEKLTEQIRNRKESEEGEC